MINKNIDDLENTALIHAICENNLNEIKKLLAQGADPILRNKEGNTAFTYAFDTCDLDIINILITK